ncbi:MAG: aldose epimerase family protein [Chloroflexota bacterium]
MTQSFGQLADGRDTTLYTLQNNGGMTVSISDYGGIIKSIWMPDREGRPSDITLGHDTADKYEADEAFMGCLIGRNANRIADGRFVLDGVEYRMAINNPPNNLHGGPGGFHAKIWKVDEVTSNQLVLSVDSPDGEEGFPGNVAVQVVYTLTDQNELQIEYVGRTDQPTVLNMTNHAYFNLAGAGRIDDHLISINADKITPVDDVSIPLGTFLLVDDTPFDLRQPSRIGNGLEDDHEQIILGCGYDHNFILNKQKGELAHAATVIENTTGRQLDVFTTEPGIQLYTGNFLKGQVGKGGMAYHKHHGFCLETQRFPDSVNQPHFPTAFLRPGETYKQTTIYQFSW